MISRFAKPYQFTRRNPGSYVNGLWVPGSEVISTRMFDIQAVTPTTSQLLQSLPEGRRSMETRVLYAEYREGICLPYPEYGIPGDLVSIPPFMWLFVTKASFDSIPGVTRHAVYLIQRVIEKAPGESPA